MQYKVIRFFTDLQDNNYPYHVGDIYPHEGVSPSQKRINELLSGENKRGVKLIEEVAKTSENGAEDASEVAVDDKPTEKVKKSEKKPARKKKTKED